MQRKRRFFTGLTVVMALMMAAMATLSGCGSDEDSGGSSRRSRNSESSYESVVNEFVDALQNEDGEAAARLVSELMIEYEGASESEIVDYLEETFEYWMEDLEDELGRNVTLRVVDIEAEVYDESDDNDDFYDVVEVGEELGYDADYISKIAQVEATIEARGREDEDSFELSFFMVQEGNSWKIWDFDDE